jgi:hypothetical protein
MNFLRMKMMTMELVALGAGWFSPVRLTVH